MKEVLLFFVVYSLVGQILAFIGGAFTWWLLGSNDAWKGLSLGAAFITTVYSTYVGIQELS